jgi:hypothetical protein
MPDFKRFLRFLSSHYISSRGYGKESMQDFITLKKLIIKAYAKGTITSFAFG